jgi:hypothetical protein
MSFNSVVIFLVSIVVMVCFIGSVIQAISERGWKWRALPYVIAMSPVAVHAYHYGLSIETALAAALFLLLTKLIIYLAHREAGSSNQ